MELICNLDESAWARADYTTKSGFDEYRIAKVSKEEPYGQYTYAVFDNYGNLRSVTLNNADNSFNPLHGINNVELRLDENGTILGICVEDDCVINKCLVEEVKDKTNTKENGVLNEDSVDNSNSSSDLQKVVLTSEEPNNDVIVYTAVSGGT